jgi:MraZ protein
MWKKVGMDHMSDYFFSGSFDVNLDEKNRFVLPQSFRYGLVEQGQLEFTLSLGLGGCLAIYRKSDMNKIIASFKKNVHVAKYQKFFTFFFSTLHHTSCDKIGRLSIPTKLKEIVGIKKEIVVAGVLDKIELWPKENYDQSLQKILSGKDEKLDLALMTQEAFALLHEEILPPTNQNGNFTP